MCIWHIFILALRIVKNYFFEVTQKRFYELILFLKVYMPPNKTEVVLFLTKNEKEDPGLGVSHTAQSWVFFQHFQNTAFFVALLLSS